LEQQIIHNRERFEHDLTEIGQIRAECEANMATLSSPANEDVMGYDETIQELRQRLMHIEEKNVDPETPHVDVDLRRQIELVPVHEQDLVKEAERCDQ
jgi:hypothetical protein